MANVYEDFLRLTGFEEEEMAVSVKEWKKAAGKLRLTEEDIQFATTDWIPNGYDIELKGIRKLLGAYVREIIELTKVDEYKERGVKIVYGILPAINHYYYALKETAPDKVYVGFPDINLINVLNGFFHRANPYLEEAESTGIPYGCRHCALNKTRYAAKSMGVTAAPDVSWIWGFICDEGPKTDEFITVYSDPEWKSYITRLPHDQPWGTVEDEVDERVEYLAMQMRDGFEFVQREIGIQVPEEKLHELINTWQRYAKKFSHLLELMATDPQPLSGQEGQVFSETLGRSFNIGLEPLEEALDITIEEVKGRIERKEGILPSGAPKLMCYFIPMTIPWVAKLFEQNDVGLTFLEAYTPSKKQLQPPRFEDPFMAAAETWLKQSFAVNIGYKAELICEKIETYSVDGMIFGFLDFDRWLGSDNRLLAKIVGERSSVPVFYIEGDVFEDRDYSPEALKTRIESICEIVKMRKA
jgi:benzoyl-CoA reductase/2-hydroxyglutaryl-CoA dehydratase subunit BcrC/BadD/HgdB